jgi:coproporphyrinogen III oxidase
MNKTEIVAFLQTLRQQIIESFETYEPTARFQKKPWNHHSGGGGEIGVIRGDVFEKAAVNWSAVSGDKFPLGGIEGPFFATGISLITHMKNPKAPTVHMNIRYIETPSKFWFGGGYDLTPMGFAFEEDTTHFHKTAKMTLDPFGKEIYPAFSKAAQDYFFIPHWKKERGVGGIFFDDYNTGDVAKDYALWKEIGTTFLSAITPIYNQRIHEPYTEEDRQKQLKLRGHYAEFNLIYDRGTKFGLLSGGNPEAILCSLPPLVSW